jgi:chemotaxis protein methyltransferase CheR
VSWTHPAYEAVIGLLGERTGLSFPPPRHESAEQGVRRAMARAGVADPEEYRARVARDARALDDLVVELTVGETYFFRDADQFEFIRRTVVPDLWRRLGADHTVRAWSCGCASGEEAFSLAIVFLEEGLGERCYLLATDISRAALARCHQASYGNWSLRGPGAAAAAPYLTQRGNRFVVHDRVRRAVTFDYLNVARDVYPSFTGGTWGMDLILCRNVLIYFDAETVRGVARRFFEALAPGGWLITAASDPPLGGEAPFEVVVTDVGVFYRRPGRDEETRRQGEKETEEHKIDMFISSSPPLPVSSSPLPPPDVLARDAYHRGDYARAADLSASLTTDLSGALLHVRALANLETGRAERACAEASSRHPLAAELHHLHAVLLLELGRDEEAARAARRVTYLDRTLALGHFTLGSILFRRGDRAGARRAYRNARDLSAARPPDEPVPLSDGMPAGRLAEAASAQLAVLGATP